jgi:hypothetical protein
VRRKAFRRDIGRQVQHGVERVAGVFGEVVVFGQRDDIKPLIEQKVDIAAREELSHVGKAFRFDISDRSFYERSLIMHVASAGVKRV